MSANLRSSLTLSINGPLDLSLDRNTVTLGTELYSGLNIYVGDVNGDGRDDTVCTTGYGGIIVWESKDMNSGNFYDPTDPWKDDLFGFCHNGPKWVSINTDKPSKKRIYSRLKF